MGRGGRSADRRRDRAQDVARFPAESEVLRRKRRRGGGLVLRTLILVAIAALAVGRLFAGGGPLPVPAPRPASDYQDGIVRFSGPEEGNGFAVPAVGRRRVLTTGQRFPRAIVLLHGFTNCPKQFDSLAPLLYEAGANVLLPRMAWHGAQDRMTPALARLTASELVHAA